ncbi:hypothetical protein [Embleya sp. NPDC020630]|uniref:hypothetical protein n=1 Tax=Embleya sp. NPDC020630 TaxID=3363979 RepID=UPI003789161B
MISGLSASANRKIAAFERSRGLPPGEVAHAFRRWRNTTRRTLGDTEPFHEAADAGICRDDHHVRTLLELALHTLRTRARRELSAAIRPADERNLRRTLNNPSAHPGLPW